MSTIDVTLGFFNDLVARKEKDLNAEMLIVEADGKIISNSSRISGPIVLKNISELAAGSTFASQVKRVCKAAIRRNASNSTTTVKPAPSSCARSRAHLGSSPLPCRPKC